MYLNFIILRYFPIYLRTLNITYYFRYSRIKSKSNTMSGAADIGKCNSFAMEKMKAKAEEDRLEKMHTKQKAGTPTVRTLLGSIYVSLLYGSV